MSLEVLRAVDREPFKELMKEGFSDKDYNNTDDPGYSIEDVVNVRGEDVKKITVRHRGGSVENLYFLQFDEFDDGYVSPDISRKAVLEGIAAGKQAMTVVVDHSMESKEDYQWARSHIIGWFEEGVADPYLAHVSKSNVNYVLEREVLLNPDEWKNKLPDEGVEGKAKREAIGVLVQTMKESIDAALLEHGIEPPPVDMLNRRTRYGVPRGYAFKAIQASK